MTANNPPALCLKVEDNNHTSRLSFGTFYWGSADQAARGGTKPPPPKPRSQTRGGKEVAVAEAGERNETTTRTVTHAKLIEPLENRSMPTAQLAEASLLRKLKPNKINVTCIR